MGDESLDEIGRQIARARTDLERLAAGPLDVDFLPKLPPGAVLALDYPADATVKFASVDDAACGDEAWSPVAGNISSTGRIRCARAQNHLGPHSTFPLGRRRDEWSFLWPSLSDPTTGSSMNAPRGSYRRGRQMNQGYVSKAIRHPIWFARRLGRRDKYEP